VIIKARQIPFYVRFFSWYAANGLKRFFNKVDVECTADTSGRPVLLIGNHFSWWDGFIAYRLNDICLHKRFHIMMLEDQLAGRMFLNKAGAFSIKRGSRSVIGSLNYASALLHEKDNMVVVYPQGAIASVHHRPVIFEKGTERIIARAPADLMILFYVALPDWYSEKKPGLRIRVTEYVNTDKSAAGLEKAYNRFLDDSVAKQLPV
jgi:1-acyl-sn-glycerol-3-phosphate acyltransferase